jgi:putative transposase
MDERLRFIARLLEAEKMAELCRESRKAGDKIFRRYEDLGLEGLTDRSRRPFRQANKLPKPIERLIVQLSASTRAGAHRRSARRLSPASPSHWSPRCAVSVCFNCAH